jgi:hypothetical protein
MKHKLLSLLLLFCVIYSMAQTKVGGHVYDEFNEPLAFANVVFKNTSEGTITNENGRFYLESDENRTTQK